jgi:hypothetical protein
MPRRVVRRRPRIQYDAYAQYPYGGGWVDYLRSVGRPLWRGIVDAGVATKDAAIMGAHMAMGGGQLALGAGALALAPYTEGATMPFAMGSMVGGTASFLRGASRIPNMAQRSMSGMVNIGSAGVNAVSPLIEYASQLRRRRRRRNRE